MKRNFTVKHELINGREAVVIGNLGFMSLSDTLECGQAFRYELVSKEDGYVEYITVAMGRLIRVGQRCVGELIFYGEREAGIDEIVRYFALDLDYEKIKEHITGKTDSDWMIRAAECSKGIHILKQESWEALFSFIISQNNNIPRIRKIIRKIASEYGENLAIKEGLSVCPKKLCDKPDDRICKSCGICYSFPTAEAVTKEPEKLLSSNPGFRYKYLVDAAKRVSLGETDLEKIENAESFEIVIEELKKILGVGDKVASCVALFGMARLEAFPIDVWMKRAIDDYFGGHLDYKSFGKWAGVAQQYIFHYIRNLEQKEQQSTSQNKEAKKDK